MPYTFTRDFFNADREAVWRKMLEPSVGKDGLSFLEIGTFEGQSALWLADNILTGNDCSMTCVDTWAPSDELPGLDMEEVCQRFMANLDLCAGKEMFTVFQGPVLGLAPHVREPYHLVYVDGSHHAAHALSDAVISWEFLAEGGVMIFDDARWKRDHSDWDNPATAVTAFMSCYSGRFETLLNGGQVWLKKL